MNLKPTERPSENEDKMLTQMVNWLNNFIQQDKERIIQEEIEYRRSLPRRHTVEEHMKYGEEIF